MDLNEKSVQTLLEEIRSNATTPLQIKPTQLRVPPHLAALLPALAAKYGFATVEEFIAAVLATGER